MSEIGYICYAFPLNAKAINRAMLYYRRKILLALLELLGGQLTAKQLQKYLFLFTRKQENKAYDFVPCHYGCYSFQANQDILTLAKLGFLSVSDTANGRQIHLERKGNYLSMLDMFDQLAMKEIKAAFGKMSQEELIRYTYVKFPFYAVNSRIAEDLLSKEEMAAVNKQKRHVEQSCLFTIGYEGITLEAYLKKLIIEDVRILCDVRKNAYSQKYGFSKAQLEKACQAVGITYVHVPSLGIDSDKRQALNTQADYDRLFDEYEATTLKQNGESLAYVRSLIGEHGRVALTCFEKDPKQCHRSRVAKALMDFSETHYTFKALL